jgi:LuxR family maltose regulon positive regulatory protein
LILQSVTLYRIGQTEEALGMLETALRLAEPEGFIRSFIDEGPVMEEMLSVYLKAHQGGPARRNPSVDLDYVKALHVGQEESVKPVRAKIRCFGRFTVLAGSGDEIKWRTSKTEGLMAYLIHHRGEPLDKHRIMESLWGDVDAERALAQLNTTVHYLRKNLSQIGLEGIVHYSRGYYRIDMGPFDCDYNEFHRMVSAGVPIDSGNFQEYEEDLARVYQTGYMDGNDYPWAEQARSSLENEYVSTLLQIHEHYVQERNFPAAAKLLKKALACDPLNEGIHTKLIHVFMLAGNRSSAM